ncbi:tannase and feruloyl esterase-domain-containing protein [Aspergillus varians]
MSVTSVLSAAWGAQCVGLQAPLISGAEVLWMASNAVQDFRTPPVIDVSGETPPNLTGSVPPLNFCNVSIALTHPGDKDTAFISVWLPPKDSWNHRYTATGGGGLAAGYDFNMVSPLAAGFAASSTDGGLTLNHTINPQSGLWGLDEDGSIEEGRLTNLGWRSIHDMSVASKDVVKQFYSVEPSYSYWVGCSQGGRQGYAAAAKYPEDFDGILANSPGLGLDSVGPAAFWPVVVMQNEGEFVPSCVFDEYQKAILEVCDPLDGATDGLISDYELVLTCPQTFNSSALIGRIVPCEDAGGITITPRHAKIVTKILDGPRTDAGERFWFGTAPGANFSGVAGTVYEDGKWTPKPFPPAAGWLQNVVVAANKTNIMQLSYDEFFAAFNISVELGAPFIGDEYLDLSDFREAGGKLLTWVGLADQYIPPMHLLEFYDQVAKKMGGDPKVNEFYRVFTAPGVGHCYGGAGPQPVAAMQALVAWVENGTAPETLAARSDSMNGPVITRELCMYPKKCVYGDGDVREPGSFHCQDPETQTGRSGNETESETHPGDKDRTEDEDQNSRASTLRVTASCGSIAWAAVWFALDLFEVIWMDGL